MGSGFFSLLLVFTVLIFPCSSSYEVVCGESSKDLQIFLGGHAGGSPSPGRGGRCYASPPPRPPSPAPRRLCSPPPPPPCPPPPPPPPPPPVDRLEAALNVIQNFKPKVTSDPFNITGSWVGNDVCKYQGISCDIDPVSNQTTVSGIDFNGYAFAGPRLTLDGFLDRFPDLTFFHANSNNFTGPIPENISQLPYFFELDLSNNKFSGSFPKPVVGASNLTFLDLRFNGYSGSVPPQLFSLDLDVIFINNNQFSNRLPNNFGSTPARYLTFANNEFTGPIPASIGNASNTLIEVLFLNNSFNGCLPYEIGFLRNATVFDASKNKLSGPIPESFGCLEKIKLLNLANNQLYGPVPESICKLRELQNLSLNSNFFTEVGPQCRDLITKNILDVSNNCITDLPNQKSDKECKQFFSQQITCPKSYKDNPCVLNPNPPDGEQPPAPAPAPAPPATAKQFHTYSALELN